MKPRAKYRAVRTNGYASKFEAKVAADLRAALAPGESLIEQVPITFACGIKYVCDFAVVADGKIVRYIEAKGMETPVWKLKLRLLKHEHPEIVEILQIVRPGGRRHEKPKRKAKKT